MGLGIIFIAAPDLFLNNLALFVLKKRSTLCGRLPEVIRGGNLWVLRFVFAVLTAQAPRALSSAVVAILSLGPNYHIAKHNYNYGPMCHAKTYDGCVLASNVFFERALALNVSKVTCFKHFNVVDVVTLYMRVISEYLTRWTTLHMLCRFWHHRKQTLGTFLYLLHTPLRLMNTGVDSSM